jgi:DNA-binding NarL/FixJ family response regulator
MADSIRVLVVDDHPVIREGIRSFLAETYDIEVVGEAEDGREAEEAVQRHAPQVILISLALPGLESMDVIRKILSARPETKIVALADAEAEALLLAAVVAGAAGFLAKSAPPAEFSKTIRQVALGEEWLPADLTRRLLARVQTDLGVAVAEALTAREREVLGLLGYGASNRDIAAELCIAEITVRTHVGRILAKLGVRNRVEAALHAVRTGLVPLHAPEPAGWASRRERRR